MRSSALAALAVVSILTACKDKASDGASSDSSEPSKGKASTSASAKHAASAAPTQAPSASAAPKAVGGAVLGFFQGEPVDDIKAWKGWINREYDFGFRIPTGWTSASLPGGGFLMNDKDQKAMIMLDYSGSVALTIASLREKSKMAPFQATDLEEVEAPTLVEVTSKKFLAMGALAKGNINKSPGQIYWMDLSGIQTHEGETGEYHFIVMIGLKDGVSDASKSQAMSAIRTMTPMSGRPFLKR